MDFYFDNILYLIPRDKHETLNSYILRRSFIVKKIKEKKDTIQVIIVNSRKWYNEKHLGCTYSSV